MGEQWHRILTDDEVRELRAWWAQREAAYAAYCRVPNPKEMGLAYGISPSCARKAAMGHTYKEIK